MDCPLEEAAVEGEEVLWADNSTVTETQMLLGASVRERRDRVGKHVYIVDEATWSARAAGLVSDASNER
jgi:fructose-specific component phosphotransferase system IIB-like protein